MPNGSYYAQVTGYLDRALERGQDIVRKSYEAAEEANRPRMRAYSAADVERNRPHMRAMTREERVRQSTELIDVLGPLVTLAPGLRAGSIVKPAVSVVKPAVTAIKPTISPRVIGGHRPSSPTTSRPLTGGITGRRRVRTAPPNRPNPPNPYAEPRVSAENITPGYVPAPKTKGRGVQKYETIPDSPAVRVPQSASATERGKIAAEEKRQRETWRNARKQDLKGGSSPGDPVAPVGEKTFRDRRPIPRDTDTRSNIVSDKPYAGDPDQLKGAVRNPGSPKQIEIDRLMKEAEENSKKLQVLRESRAKREAAEAAARKSEVDPLTEHNRERNEMIRKRFREQMKQQEWERRSPNVRPDLVHPRGNY